MNLHVEVRPVEWILRQFNAFKLAQVSEVWVRTGIFFDNLLQELVFELLVDWRGLDVSSVERITQLEPDLRIHCFVHKVPYP